MKTHLFHRFSAVLVVPALLFSALPALAATTIVVAADGSGEFKSVQEAVMKIPDGRADNPVVIEIKPGTYKEPIYIQREKRFFHLVGEDPKTTVLTCDLYANMKDKDGRPIGTFRTPSTQIDADDFTAENLTFENSAGPVGQALACGWTAIGASFAIAGFSAGKTRSSSIAGGSISTTATSRDTSILSSVARLRFSTSVRFAA